MSKKKTGIIELSDILRELEHERACVVSTYSDNQAYRDAVLEGLRVAEVIARDSATTTKFPPTYELCPGCGKNIKVDTVDSCPKCKTRF